jgi:transposase
MREFKLEAAKLIQEREVTMAQASRDLGLQGTVLRRWVEESPIRHRPFHTRGR